MFAKFLFMTVHFNTNLLLVSTNLQDTIHNRFVAIGNHQRHLLVTHHHRLVGVLIVRTRTLQGDVLQVHSITTEHHSLLPDTHLVTHQDAVMLAVVISIAPHINFVPTIYWPWSTPETCCSLFYSDHHILTHHDSHFNRNEQIDNINHLNPYALTEAPSYDHMASEMTSSDHQTMLYHSYPSLDHPLNR